MSEKVKQECRVHGVYIAGVLRFGGKIMYTMCPKCGDARDAEYMAVKGVLRAQDRHGKYIDSYPYMAIPARYAINTLSTIKPTGDLQKTAISKLMKSVNTSPVKSFILIGDGGSGKTHLLTATISGLSGQSCGYTTMQGMVSRVLDSIRDKRASVTSQRLAYTSPDILIIDDVSGMSPTHRDILDDVITSRHAESRPIMIGTSLQPDSLRAVIGPRATRRLQEMGTHCIFIS